MASGDGDGKSWFQSWALFPRRRGNRASAHSSGSRNSRPKHNAATAADYNQTADDRRLIAALEKAVAFINQAKQSAPAPAPTATDY